MNGDNNDGPSRLKIEKRSRSEPATKRGDERRRAFLRTAAQLFEDRGFADVSINEIVRRSGGSLATVYRWFGGKDELFFAVFDELLQNAGQRFRAVELTGETAEDDFRIILEAIFAFQPFRLVRFLLFGAGKIVEKRNEALEKVAEYVDRELIDLFERIYEKHQIRSDFSARELAFLFVRTTRGRLVELTLDPNDVGRQYEAIRLTLRMLTALVEPQNGAKRKQCGAPPKKLEKTR